MFKRSLLLCFLFASCILMYAQQAKTISGIVSDSSTGEVLIGAVVKESDTNATVTDIDGKYTLNVSGNKVVVSYIGYSPRTTIVNNSGNFDIKMNADTELDEVIVVGYGVQRKSDLTGAISSISGKDLQNQAASNVSNLLAGKASGVFVAASSGQPGSSAVVRIRGLGTVNDNNPLYVVDGQFMDNINNVNPSDIERMEILKDASSLAIYGSRGSSGVIIITTKGGEKGKTIVNLDMSLGIKNNNKAPKMMNSDQYYDFIMTSRRDDSNWDDTAASGDAYNFTQLYKRGYNTNWWDESTRTGFTQNYNASVRKGDDNSRTVLSLGYMGEEGTIITSDFNRISARLGQEYDIKNIVTVGANVNIAKMKQRKTDALGEGTFNNILKAEPFTPVINPLVDPNSENYKYNKYAPTEWTFEKNPVGQLSLPNRYNDLFNVFGNVFANVNLSKGLTYRFQYSLERNNDKFHEFMPLYVNTFTDFVITDKAGKESNTRPSLKQSETRALNQTLENRVNYNNKFGKHLVDLMGAVTYEKRSLELLEGYGAGAIGNDEEYEVLESHLQSQTAHGTKLTTSMMSYLGRINYSYDNKYLLTANFRADGSSAFSQGNRWGYFPSVSVGWRITNEQFFQSLNTQKWLDDMKLRAGWGRNGNAKIDQQSALTLVGSGKEDKWSFDGKNLSQGYYLKYTGNKNLRWETSEQLNIGLDATLFNQSNNTLSLSMDYYIKTTRDVLLPFELPAFGGFTNSPNMNAGKIENKGFDFSANYTNSTIEDMRFTAGINLSTYTTEIKSLSIDGFGQDYLPGNNGRSYLNNSFNKFWGYKQIGIFQNQAEVDNYVDSKGNKLQPNALPGDFIFADVNGDGVVNDDDRTFIGDPNPDLIFGFNFGFEYKNFDVSMSFQGTLGNDIWNVSKGDLASPGFQNAMEEVYTKAWRNEGDNTKYPRMTTANQNKNYRASSFYVEDGSYLRLQNLQVGYNLPASICKNLKVFSSLRLFASGQNLFTLTKYSGLDPELGTEKIKDLGVDIVRYPTARTFLFGLNAQF